MYKSYSKTKPANREFLIIIHYHLIKYTSKVTGIIVVNKIKTKTKY